MLVSTFAGTQPQRHESLTSLERQGFEPGEINRMPRIVLCGVCSMFVAPLFVFASLGARVQIQGRG